MQPLACMLEKSPRVEQRKFARVELGAPVSVRQREGGRENGVIHNLSVGGCAIEARGDYPVGARLFVTIAHFQPFVGRVAWYNGERFGVEFEAPLHPAVVDHIARANP